MIENEVFTNEAPFNVSNAPYSQKVLGGSDNIKLPEEYLKQYYSQGYFKHATEITCSGGFVKKSNGYLVPATSAEDAEGIVVFYDMMDANNLLNKKGVVANKFKNGDNVFYLDLADNTPIDPYIICVGAKKDDFITLKDGDLLCSVGVKSSTDDEGEEIAGDTVFAKALTDADKNGVVKVKLIKKVVL